MPTKVLPTFFLSGYPIKISAALSLFECISSASMTKAFHHFLSRLGIRKSYKHVCLQTCEHVFFFSSSISPTSGLYLVWPRCSASNAFLDFSPHTFYTKIQVLMNGSNIGLTCRVSLFSLFSLLFVVPHWHFPTEDVFNSKLCDMGWNLCVKAI